MSTSDVVKKEEAGENEKGPKQQNSTKKATTSQAAAPPEGSNHNVTSTHDEHTGKKEVDPFEVGSSEDGSDVQEDEEEVLSHRALFTENNIVELLVSYACTTDLLLAVQHLNRLSFRYTRNELSHRETKEQEDEESRSEKGGNNSSSLLLRKYFDQDGLVVLAFMSKPHCSMFIRSSTLQPGYLVQGVLVGALCQRMFHVGSFSKLPISKMEGVWYVGPTSNNNKNNLEKKKTRNIPYPYQILITFESGLQCQVDNTIGARQDLLNEQSPFVEVSEVKVIFPPLVGPSHHHHQSSSSAGMVTRSMVHGECEFGIPAHLRKPILGSDACQSFHFGNHFTSINEVSRSAGMAVTVSIIIEGFSCVGATLNHVHLYTTLSDIRKCITDMKILLPDKYEMKRFTKSATNDENVDTVFDALPSNRGQFVHWEISQDWPALTHCGWPEGVQVLHDKVLAIVILPHIPSEDDLQLNATMTTAMDPLPVGGVQRAKAIRSNRMSRENGSSKDSSVTSMQLMFHVMQLGYECCRNGDMSTLNSLLRGKHLGSVQRVEAKAGGKPHRTTVSIEYPTLPVDEAGPLGISLLHTAVDAGRKEIVDFLIREGAQVCHSNHLGQIPLHIAAQRGHAECIPLLLRAPNGIYAINKQDVLGRTPLHLCLAKGFINTALWLVEQGADVNIVDSEGHSPCSIASRLLPSIGDLIAQGNIAGIRLMLKVALENRDKLFHPLSEGGKAPSEKERQNTSASGFSSSGVFEDLHAFTDPVGLYVEGLKYRLTKGHLLCELRNEHTINRKNGKIVPNVTRNSALHLAVESENAKIVSLLVQCLLVDIAAGNHCGDNALHRAAAKGNLDVLQTLLAAQPLASKQTASSGISGLQLVAHRNDKGQYPLHLALHFHNYAAAATLVQHCTPEMLRQKDSYGSSACHYALLLPDSQLQLTQEILSNSLINYHLQQGDEKQKGLAPFPCYSALQKAYCQKFGKKELEEPTVESRHFSSLCEVAVGRRKLSVVQFLVSFMKRCIEQNRWPEPDFGDAPAKLLLQAFHCGSLDIFSWLETELKLDASALMVPDQQGEEIPLVSYILLHAMDLQWANHLLSNDGLVLKLLQSELDVNIVALLCKELAAATPSLKYCEEMIPGVLIAQMTQQRSQMSPAEKRRSNKKGFQLTPKNYTPLKREILSAVLQNTLNALSLVASAQTTADNGKILFRTKILNAAFRCQALPAAFVCLEKFLADQHQVDVSDILQLLRLPPHYHVSIVNGVSPLALIHGGEIPTRQGTAATATSAATGKSARGARAPSADRSSRESKKETHGDPATFLASALSTGASLLQYSAICVQREKQLCKLIPFLIPGDPGRFLHELCSLRYFAAALALVSSPTAVPYGASLRCDFLEKESGKSALHLACGYNAALLVSALLLSAQFTIEEDSEEKLKPIHYACRYGHSSTVTVLLQAGMDVNCAARLYLDASNITVLGVTPLHFAAESGNIDLCRLLLEHDAVADLEDTNLQTPLHYACRQGHDKIGQLLLQNGANVEKEDLFGQTPVMLAARHGLESTVLSIIASSKADHLFMSINPKTGQSLAHFAAWLSMEQLIERICTADKNSQKMHERRKSLKEPEPLLRHISARPAETNGGKQPQDVPAEQNEKEGAAFDNEDIPSFIKVAVQGGGKTTEQQLPYLSHVFGGKPFANPSSMSMDTTSSATTSCKHTLSTNWLPSHGESSRCGLNMLCASLASQTTAVPVPKAAEKADGGKKSPPLQILSSLFAATANERQKSGNQEAHKAIGKVAKLLHGMEPYSESMQMDETFTQTSKATIYHGEQSILLLPDQHSTHKLTPLHYIYANGQANLCSIVKRANLTIPDVILDRDTVLAEEAKEKQREEEDAKNRAQYLQYPKVDAPLTDAVRKKAAEIEELMMAKPAPPPIPTPRWHDGYYGLGADGVTGHFQTPIFHPWDFSTTEALFTSRNLQAMIWMIHRDMTKEIANRLPLLPSVDTPLDGKGTTMLMLASYLNKFNTVKALLENGANVNALVYLRARGSTGGEHGLTPLLLACFASSMETVEILLANGANPNTSDECGNTSLHHCVARRHFKLAKILLRNRADIEIKNNIYGELPEDIAVQLRDTNIRRLLYWWGVAGTVKQHNHQTERTPCESEITFKYWDEASKTYYKRLDLLHKDYISFMNQSEEHSVPCLLYNRICKLMNTNPARSVLNQLRVFWWPEEVRAIDLGGIYLGVQGMSTVICLMKVLPRLESLDLSGSKITYESIAELCSFALHHQGLRKINVRNNKEVGKLCSQKIMDLLKANPKIVLFDVTETAIETHVQGQISRMADSNKRTQAMGYSDLSYKKSPSPMRRRQSPARQPPSPDKYMSTSVGTSGEKPRSPENSPVASPSPQ